MDEIKQSKPESELSEIVGEISARFRIKISASGQVPATLGGDLETKYTSLVGRDMNGRQVAVDGEIANQLLSLRAGDTKDGGDVLLRLIFKKKPKLREGT